MTIPADLRKQIRQYANFACEFCGVTETDTGGQLTLDHYQPKAKGGEDRFENLLYCYRNKQQPYCWNSKNFSRSSNDYCNYSSEKTVDGILG